MDLSIRKFVTVFGVKSGWEIRKPSTFLKDTMYCSQGCDTRVNKTLRLGGKKVSLESS
jgi:hypothetical protein